MRRPLKKPGPVPLGVNVGRYDVAEVKRQAAGRWTEILVAQADIPAELLDGKHHPCPKCGGKDRFRLINAAEGALFCNGCFDSKNGDGLAAIQHFRGTSFPKAVALVAQHLGIQPSRNGRSKKRRNGPTFADVDAAVKDLMRKNEGERAYVWHYDKFAVVRIDLPTPSGEKQRKTFRPIHPFKLADNRKAWRFGYPEGKRSLYRRADLEGRKDLSLAVVVGGEKATDAAVKLGLEATTCAGGEKAIRSTDWAPVLRFDQVAVSIDNDEAGEQYGQRVSATLLKLKSELVVKIIRLPGLPPKGDFVEWIAAGGTREEFLRLVETAEVVTAEQVAEWATARKDNLPEIIVTTDEPKVVDQAVSAITSEPNLYQRGGQLVHIIESAEPPRGIERPQGAPRIAILRHARLREIMATWARWLRPAGDEGFEPCHVPKWAVDALAARERWEGIRPLEGVVESPVLRTDGSIVTTPGYDEATGLVFTPLQPFPEIPSKPSRDDAIRARDTLLEIVVDFPVAAPAHRSAWLASALTPFARFAFFGCAPLNLVDANVRGSGKSLLVDATGAVFSCRGMARMTAPRDGDEWRKRITSLVVAGEPLILIDNISGFFGNAELDAALTGTTWSDRVLGKNEMVSGLPLTATWYGTANNAILGADTARRALHIRLESPEEKPEERSGFRHPQLLDWVRREQPRLATAAVTILSAYCHAGRPDQRLTPWGSFEAWSGLVRQAVAWIDMPDPAETRTELADQADHEGNALRLFIDAMDDEDPDGDGLTAAEMLRLIDGDQAKHHEALRNAIIELVPVKGGGRPLTRSLGMKLRHLRRRNVGGRFLDKKDTRQGALWLVYGSATPPTRGVCCGSSDSSGSSGSTLTPPARAGARTHAHAQMTSAPVEPLESLEPQNELTPEQNEAVEDFLR